MLDQFFVYYYIFELLALFSSNVLLMAAQSLSLIAGILIKLSQNSYLYFNMYRFRAAEGGEAAGHIFLDSCFFLLSVFPAASKSFCTTATKWLAGVWKLYIITTGNNNSLLPPEQPNYWH